jgi:hypothetical protein
MKRLSVMVMVLALATGGAMAGEIFGTSYTYIAPTGGEFEDDVSQHEIKVRGGAQLLSADDHGYDLFLGGGYQATIWSFDDSRLDELDLHKLTASLTGVFKASENILIKAEVKPGIHSDFEDVDEDDSRIEGSLVGTYVQSPELQWVLGVGFGEDFGDPAAFPIVGARWQATENLLARLVFPKPRVTYSLSDDLRIFMAAEPTGGQWNVGDEDVDRQVDVELKGFRTGIGGEFQVCQGGWLHLMVGAETGRELQVGIDEDDAFDDEVEMEDTAFVQIGFGLR